MSLTLKYDLRIDDVECDICGFSPVEEVAEVLCSIPDPRLGATHRQTHYEACLDCLKAGPASFPDRILEHARQIQEGERKKVRRLQDLADGQWSLLPGVTYANIMREHEEHEEHEEREEERRRADVQSLNYKLAELRAKWSEYQFTVKRVAE